jgi:predicted Zn-dependent protease with MMP-like domain
LPSGRRRASPAGLTGRSLLRRHLRNRRAICAICRTKQEVADQVRRTVVHGIAHPFGIDDDRLTDLGW